MWGLPHVMRPGSHFPSLSSVPTGTGPFLGSPCPLEAELAAAVPGSEPLTSTLKMPSSRPGKGLIAFHCLDYILCPSINQSLWPGKCNASVGSDLGHMLHPGAGVQFGPNPRTKGLGELVLQRKEGEMGAGGMMENWSLHLLFC